MPSSPAPFEQPIYVVRPLLPPLTSYTEALKGIWERQWLTNKGPLHDELERALCAFLHIPLLSLTASGTIALTLAFKALQLSGEVITTAFTSPATPNAASWCGLTPVFADIDPTTWTLDPNAVERAITSRTSSILGVHIYGMPCDLKALQTIAKYHNLKLVYDGAHAFGTEINGEPITNFGDATALSFHATKFYNTAEGGAVAASDPEIKRRVDLLRTLGILNETSVVLPGINGRMNELEAALGLANLEFVEQEYRSRSGIAEIYRGRLKGIDGLSLFELPSNVRNSHNYFVVRIDRSSRVSRDQLNDRLKAFNVFTRRYFYPVCSEFPFYRDMNSSHPENLKVAHVVSREVLCLPFYGRLGAANAHRVCDMIEYVMKT
jgi:dTDP-4-amino-4,6-dideoxygalactose transaminase